MVCCHQQIKCQVRSLQKSEDNDLTKVTAEVDDATAKEGSTRTTAGTPALTATTTTTTRRRRAKREVTEETGAALDTLLLEAKKVRKSRKKTVDVGDEDSAVRSL